MIHISGKIDGLYAVTQDTEMHGTFVGPVTVKPRVMLILNGLVEADLFVKAAPR